MVKTVGVIGAGQMGAGIAQICAAIGKNVVLCDIKQEFLDNGIGTITKNLTRSVSKERISQKDMDNTLGNVSTTLELNELNDRDIIIEAIVENIDIKKKLFSDLGDICNESTILASNTSSIPIGILAEASRRPAKVVGKYFGMSSTALSNDNTFDATFKLAEDLNKVPVLVNDFPGFVSNRILLPMLNEAMFCVMEGVAEPEAIDTVMKLGMSHPMGPLTLADFIGLDTCLAIMEVLHRDFNDDKYRPCPLLKEMVEQGKLGKKSGEGFYKY